MDKKAWITPSIYPGSSRYVIGLWRGKETIYLNTSTYYKNGKWYPQTEDTFLGWIHSPVKYKYSSEDTYIELKEGDNILQILLEKSEGR